MILNQIQNEAHAIQEMFSMLMSLIVQSNLPVLPIMIQLYRQLLVEFFLVRHVEFSWKTTDVSHFSFSASEWFGKYLVGKFLKHEVFLEMVEYEQTCVY